MTILNDRLQQEFENALKQSKGTHNNNINQDHLDLFKRVIRIDPEKLRDVLAIYLANLKAHRSNLIPGLYALVVLADVCVKAKQIISGIFPDDELTFYEEDESSDIANNAKILRQVLNGASLSKIQTKENTDTNKGDTSIIQGDANGSVGRQAKQYDGKGKGIPHRSKPKGFRWNSPEGIALAAAIITAVATIIAALIMRNPSHAPASYGPEKTAIISPSVLKEGEQTEHSPLSSPTQITPSASNADSNSDFMIPTPYPVGLQKKQVKEKACSCRSISRPVRRLSETLTCLRYIHPCLRNIHPV